LKPFDSQFLQAALLIASPLLFVALGELLSETAGVINVGLEGMMLVGAFAGFWAGGELDNLWLAVLVGVLAGMGMAAIMGFATIEARADQIVVGVALNIIGAGLSVFAFQKYSTTKSNLFIDRMTRIDVPKLESIPLIGPALFRQIPLVYVSLLVVPIVWVLFYKTRWGLRMRAAGELPEADETAGVSVRSLRWQGVLIAGALAGLGGAMLSVGVVGTFLGGMTAGRGFLALAAVIVGGWRPLGVAVAALLFGAADALQLRLQAETFVPRSVWVVLAALFAILVYRLTRARIRRSEVDGERRSVSVEIIALAAMVAGATLLALVQPHVSLPSLLWLALPYALTIAALAGVIVRVRQPRALGIPFVRGGGD
jgi:simple sugar transport system permease protein